MCVYVELAHTGVDDEPHDGLIGVPRIEIMLREERGKVLVLLFARVLLADAAEGIEGRIDRERANHPAERVSAGDGEREVVDRAAIHSSEDSVCLRDANGGQVLAGAVICEDTGQRHDWS